MRQILLPGTRLPCSRFVFGTASLFNAGRSPVRRRLLDTAVDQGFTHFDTAPLYGFGAAERDLAPVLRAHPHLTVATKIGLHPPGGPDQPEPLTFLRKAAGRVLPALSQAREKATLSYAQRSLEGSLRRLNRERIDLLMLHEPDLSRIDAVAYAEWLERQVAAGQIGAFGIALASDRLAPFLGGSPLTEVIQTQDSLDRREADAVLATGRPLQLTYGYMSAARSRGDTAPATDILRRALERNDTGAILVTTNKPERIAQYGHILAEAA